MDYDSQRQEDNVFPAYLMERYQEDLAGLDPAFLEEEEWDLYNSLSAMSLSSPQAQHRSPLWSQGGGNGSPNDPNPNTQGDRGDSGPPERSSGPPERSSPPSTPSAPSGEDHQLLSRYPHTDQVSNSGVVWGRVSPIHPSLLQEAEITINVSTPWVPHQLPIPTMLNKTVQTLIGEILLLLEQTNPIDSGHYLLKLCDSEEYLRK
ncbi:unnamed protein product [Coregonus sp. 'balchen']|nr:unnamed protein product [Coregonus sp. 'balchen']